MGRIKPNHQSLPHIHKSMPSTQMIWWKNVADLFMRTGHSCSSIHPPIHLYILHIYIHIHLSICLHTCVNIRVYIYLFIYIPSIFYGLNSWRFTRTMARPKLETWAASILLHLSAFRAHPMVEVGMIPCFEYHHDSEGITLLTTSLCVNMYVGFKKKKNDIS